MTELKWTPRHRDGVKALSGSREELLSPVDPVDEAAVDIASEQNNEEQDLFSVLLAGENDFCPLAVTLEETASDEITERDMSVSGGCVNPR